MIDATRRNNETTEQHRIRLEQQQVTDNTRRNNETTEEHRYRLDKQQVINITNRNNETSEERSARNRSDSRRRQQRMLEKKSNPPVKIWPAAISQKVKENCLSEFNKRMSMDSLREQICVVCNSRHNEKTMHNVLLSNINDALLKPHQSLHEMIPGIRSANAQDTDFDEEMIFSNKQGCYRIHLQQKKFLYTASDSTTCISPHLGKGTYERSVTEPDPFWNFKEFNNT
ncbi:unnamed protein product [Adineta steineri]|uniref:Uncharacterized protein n=1 Tax=Adineta steineri TaxID=433720 RepID=A0A815RKU5_9BILA|nr:unnamed protein product [Adineta steineri]